MQESLIIAYGLATDSRDPVTLIMLEQEGFAPYTGRVTKAAMAKFIANLMYNKDDELGIQCGFDGEHIVEIINAYPYYPNLNYQLLTSHGELSAPSIEEVEKQETVQLKMDDSVSVKYPVLSISSAEWLSDAYNEDMELISPPPAIIIGDDYKTVTTSIPCYGSVAVTYMAMQHQYVLTITKLEGAEDNKYTSIVFAVYDGGLVYLETEPPEGADEFDGDCAWDGDNWQLTGLEPPDDDGPPNDARGDSTRRIDYCRHKILSENVTW